MGEMVWHCRETRQQTEKTNIDLESRQGEIPEGLSGSERLACKKRSVENLGIWKILNYVDPPKIARFQRGRVVDL